MHLFRIAAAVVPLSAGASTGTFDIARPNGKRFDEMAAACHRLLHAWLKQADARTLLLPDRLPGRLRGLKPADRSKLDTPHNSGADLYQYLGLTDVAQ